MSQDDDDRESHHVEINGISIELTTSENDFNSEKKTLFATKVWEGAKVLSKFILDHSEEFIVNKSVIEFGAGKSYRCSGNLYLFLREKSETLVFFVDGMEVVIYPS